MIQRSGFLAAIALAGGVMLSGGAIAQTMSPLERDILALLGPTLRAEVETRMQQPNQRVHEILDTILLNKISQAFASGRIVATDYIKGIVVAEGRDGSLRMYRFDVPTLELRPI